ncbi:MAG: iron-sulfur cluster assembly scaffold protein [Desulfarculus sp.]|nr:MAG: iron-sulfur cluster assembly scaffold protein [Desulfarculus sp.]
MDRHEPHPGEEAPGLNEAFLTHALTPQNLGVLPNPDGFAAPQGTCGDHLELYLRISDGKINEARFLTDGCLHTVACGSALTCLIKGLPLEQAAQVGAAQIESELGGLPKDHRHCAALAAATLKAALRGYFRKRRDPWKELYRRG